MKLQVTQANLNKALGLTAKVAASRGLTLPILQNVLLRTNNNRLEIAATNLDIAITCHIGAKIDIEGSITVPARIFSEFISNLPSGVINLDTIENRLKVSASSHQSTINGVSAEDYPDLPEVEKAMTLSMPAQVFKNALSKIVFAAGNDDTRPVLTGVLLHSRGESNPVMIAATDSYRLSHFELPITSDQEFRLLIPASAMSEVLRSIDDSIEEIQVEYDESKISFSIGDIGIVCRLIDGKYPDYINLIPSDFTTTVTVGLDDLQSLAKVSGIFAKESAGGITIEVSAPESRLSVRSIASQLGENNSELPVVIEGDSLAITLNSRYLSDGLNTIDSPKLDLCFNGPTRPVLLRDASQAQYIHLIMPVVA